MVAHVPFPHRRQRRWASGFAGDDRPLGTLLFPFPTILFPSGCGIEQPKLRAFGSEYLTQLLVYACIIPISSDFWQNYWVPYTARPWIRQMGCAFVCSALFFFFEEFGTVNMMRVSIAGLLAS